jgi:hypothetical protein
LCVVFYFRDRVGALKLFARTGFEP